MELQELISLCTVEGNMIKPPGRNEVEISREDYLILKKAVEKAGGKWKSGKIAAWVFLEDPSDIYNLLSRGEKVDPVKEFQFFQTPKDRAIIMAKKLAIDPDGGKCRILEPSAGMSRLLNATYLHCINNHLSVELYAFELNESMANKIEESPQVTFLGHDFMEASNDYVNYFDRIIANPPFSKGQEVDHVMQMMRFLKPSGRLVTIMSNAVLFRNDKKYKALRELLGMETSPDITDNLYYSESPDYELTLEQLPSDEFKESGTMVQTVMMIIDKKDTAISGYIKGRSITTF